MKKQIALTLGAMALFGLMATTAHAKRSNFEVRPAKVDYMASLGNCGDPGMIASSACDGIAKEVGLSKAQRRDMANNIQCDHVAELVGAYAERKGNQRTRLEM